MEEDAARTEPSSATGSTQALAQPKAENNADVLIPSFTPSSVPSSPAPTSTLSRLGLKSPTSPTGAAPGSPIDRGQVSAITVVALLDKLVNMMESVQDNQQRMEQRQADLEGAVRVVQGDVTRLSKTHVSTSNSVSKLLERSRKVSDHLKEVRERLDKQAVQVKKLEANHSHLLKRNHFKVLIFQEDNEIPSTVFVKDSLKTPQPSQYDAESTLTPPSVTGSVDGIRGQEEGLQSISLSSDEESLPVHLEGEDYLVGEEAMGMGTSRTYERRADKFKRSSLKKVDSLKKAFSRTSIEKKVNQITTRIVPPEKREKIMKSLTPNHPKSPTAKSSSFKVSPMTFNVKKVRDGETPTQDASSPGEEAHIEIPPIENMDGEIPLAEAHTDEGAFKELQESVSPSTPESMKVELEINGGPPSIECEVNNHCAGLAVPEDMEDIPVEVEVEEVQEKSKSPVEAAADAQSPVAAVGVEPVST
ncbi:caveolae-associated protein 2-like [Takifugu flavidus]|uniref:Caveolae-associated protein 2 n=1 Tax=Takifugu flavidus TaxID=433684 RepID=A0A5C6PNU8_9TELE|nr:caveolae-associated protein 2-like [Takifugu flavidus]TWW80501.1 Caveolae-associated protein 2 [Takifugu flavidus]